MYFFTDRAAPRRVSRRTPLYAKNLFMNCGEKGYGALGAEVEVMTIKPSITIRIIDYYSIRHCLITHILDHLDYIKFCSA